MARGSIAFARIKREILKRVELVGAGRVGELPQLAEALNIPPRHAAYILSRLTPDERALAPWHRIVPRDGRFPVAEKRSPVQKEQIRLLAAEGLGLGRDRRIEGFEAVRHVFATEHARTIWADEPDE